MASDMVMNDGSLHKGDIVSTDRGLLPLSRFGAGRLHQRFGTRAQSALETAVRSAFHARSHAAAFPFWPRFTGSLQNARSSAEQSQFETAGYDEKQNSRLLVITATRL